MSPVEFKKRPCHPVEFKAGNLHGLRWGLLTIGGGPELGFQHAMQSPVIFSACFPNLQGHFEVSIESCRPGITCEGVWGFLSTLGVEEGTTDYAHRPIFGVSYNFCNVPPQTASLTI